MNCKACKTGITFAHRMRADWVVRVAVDLAPVIELHVKSTVATATLSSMHLSRGQKAKHKHTAKGRSAAS